MRTIHKFELEVVDEQEVPMPSGAQLLSVQVQPGDTPIGGTVCLWAIVDSNRVTVGRLIVTHGTGSPLGDGEWLEGYVDTYQILNGELVFHVFDGGEVDA